MKTHLKGTYWRVSYNETIYFPYCWNKCTTAHLIRGMGQLTEDINNVTCKRCIDKMWKNGLVRDDEMWEVR